MYYIGIYKIKPNFLLSLYLGIATSSTMTAIPSTPPMGIPRNSHQSRSGSPTKSGSQPGGYPGPTGSPVPPMPPQSYQQVGADLTDNVANFAQSTFSTFSNFLQKPEKLASGKDNINDVDLMPYPTVTVWLENPISPLLTRPQCP